jgi:Ni,Fe-hydrogenase III large subunit
VPGYGLFTIPHSPVRSGVIESTEYLAGTSGANIPHLSMRVSCKHCGIEKRYEGMTGGDGALLAERIAGCQPTRTAGPGPAAARRARADRQPGGPGAEE